MRVRRVVLADGHPRFHRVHDQAVIDDLDPCRPLGLGERGLGGCPVAVFPGDGEVARSFAVQLWRAGRQGRGGVGHGWPVVVVDDDQLCRLHGLGVGLGDHHRDGIADMPYDPSCQDRVGRLLHFAVTALHLGEDRNVADVLGRQVFCREDQQDSRQVLGVARVDAGDFGVGQGAADDRHVGLVRQVNVVGIARVTCQEPPVLDTSDALAFAELAHTELSCCFALSWATPAILSAADHRQGAG